MNLCVVLSTVALFIEYVSSGDIWHYDGNWNHEFEFCSASDQSPINVNFTNVIKDPTKCDSNFDWTIDSSKKLWQVINNGHSIVLKPVELFEIDGLTEDQIEARRRMQGITVEEIEEHRLKELDLNENTIARFPNYFSPEGSTTKHYCLDSIHFHWGTNSEYGSEHTLNGKHFPIEAHFVHFACEHDDLGSALEKYKTVEEVKTARDNGEDVYVLGVVSMTYKLTESEDTSFSQLEIPELFEKLKHPHSHSHSTGATAIVIDGFELGARGYSDDLLPYINDGYWSYEGSLTTPPCTDIVRWFIINEQRSGTINEKQLEMFRQVLNENGESVAPNYREIQNNPNNVYLCDYVDPDDLITIHVDGKDSDDMTPAEAIEQVKKIAIYSAIAVGVLCLCGCVGLAMFCMGICEKKRVRLPVRNDDSEWVE